MLLRALTFCFGLVAVFGLFWVMWPSSIQPAYWNEPRPPAMTGVLARNGVLDQARRYAIGEPGTATGLTLAADGSVYFGTPDGHIHRFIPGRPENPVQEIARITDTPIYGLGWAEPHVLAIASQSGLYALDLVNGSVDRLSIGVAAHPFGFVNDLTVAADGTIFFTDSSARWQLMDRESRYFREMLENRPTGSIYAWNPALDQTVLVRDQLHYPNGIVMAPGGDSLLFSETFRHRIMRLWLHGPDAGMMEVVASNLPGYPDSLTLDPQGRLVVSMLTTRDPALRTLHRHPALASLYTKLPAWLRPNLRPAEGFILVLDPRTGAMLDSLHASDDRFCLLSDAEIGPVGGVWIGSINCGYIGRLPGLDRPHADHPDNRDRIAPIAGVDADIPN
ncbi:SMP-30/gluconolactonase/LRE family protein [Maricaulis parjimensis]|uniref:SMP-30/gluconolactonase/LRE family protein n=1 Tax=Maricaulis parjimensis TaxID=144023 RepID=UPI001939551D|nr:SMP-30/gluconolactonase/LRE family protein [Maricaulis parjimensis]